MIITIKTCNAAFHDGYGPAPEVARILRKLADRLESGGLPRVGCAEQLQDSNGNYVGKAEGH